MASEGAILGKWQKRIVLVILFALLALSFYERAEIVRFLRPPETTAEDSPRIGELLPGVEPRFSVHEASLKSLGIAWTRATESLEPTLLSLSGKLFLDPNRLVNVHARFSGEIVELGKKLHVDESATSREDQLLRFGERVEKGQLLAVLWSREVGNEKSDLVEAISRMRLDEKTLKRLKELETSGAVAERSVREAQRNFEADLISANRAERTLRSWRFTDEDIVAIKEEANRLHDQPSQEDSDIDRKWAQVEIPSPISGVIVEQNSPVGDVVDSGDVLFKIADLRRIGVMGNLYEDDLPRVLAIPEKDRKMAVHLANDPSGRVITVPVDRIGDVIDPNQHTVAVIGWIDNADGVLRSGQFVTETIDLPGTPGVVSVPASCVIDKGRTGTVFISNREHGTEFEMRTVGVARRSAKSTWLRQEPTAEEKAHGAKPVRPGEWVVSSGVLSLAGILDDLREEGPQESSRKGQARP